jgi:RNA polymerase sigma-70 factor (ECF subfamily)
MSRTPPPDFDAERPRLTSIAVRILGSASDADDVIQEAYLRLAATAADTVEELPAWLTTVVTRLCLDHLRKRRTRAHYEGNSAVELSPIEPEADALLAETVGAAMQMVLDALTPAERAAFVLHDVFGYPFDDVGTILGRSPATARQLASRARRKLRGVPEPASERTARQESRRVVEAFLAAARGGELTTLLSLLAPDAVMTADVAGQNMGAHAVYDGPNAVAERFNGARGATPVNLDGDAGAAWFMAGSVKVAFAFHVVAGKIREVELIGDPDVLATLDVARISEPTRPSSALEGRS